ncbi:MAG TPA: hypothetical protein VK013_02995 [Myxococcaceae bacterium]|nr:hypothetical protein [Myxococcaceae bacterium]
MRQTTSMGEGAWSRRLLGGLLMACMWAGAGCREEPPPPSLTSLAPEPLPRVTTAAEDASVVPITPRGASLPSHAEVFELNALAVEDGSLLKRAGQVSAKTSVVLRPDGEVYLAQAAPILAALADQDAEVWLAHPEGAFGYRLMLFDEPAYQHWMDLPEPGRLRVVMRGDGYELATSVGKLPGPDRNGPSVPLRQGRNDLGRLRLALQALLGRFTTEDMICWVPSFGMELATVARSLAATYEEDGDPLFKRQCLVFPRPK